MIILLMTSNAVNLTDGLDGLAISVFTVAAGAFTALTYVSGHAVIADFLLIVRFPPAGELTIFCGSLVGAGLGFLWYNSYPADVFMGDVGSLALGGALGTVALLIKQELLLPIVGAVFLIEMISVVIQVGSFKNFKSADALKAKLAFSGLSADIQKTNIIGKGISFRVFVGPFEDKEKKDAVKKILAANSIDSVTIEHKIENKSM